jgi:peptide/nickel transport system permease protein
LIEIVEGFAAEIAGDRLGAGKVGVENGGESGLIRAADDGAVAWLKGQGRQAGTMLGGSVVVESVFALPGLGRLAYESVVQRDLNTLLGIVFISAVLVIVINFVVDMAYARLDPRIGAGR